MACTLVDDGLVEWERAVDRTCGADADVGMAGAGMVAKIHAVEDPAKVEKNPGRCESKAVGHARCFIS